MNRKINELEQERATKVAEMKSIVLSATDENRVKTDDESTKFDALKAEIKELDGKLENERFLLANSKEEVKTVANTEAPNVADAFRDFLTTGQAPEAYRGSAPNKFLLRGVLQTTTNADGAESTVAPGLVIAKSPAKVVLDKIGVNFKSGLIGTYTESGMAQLTAGTVAETVSVADASATPYSNTLSAKRSGAYQVVTKEELAQTNPQVFSDIIQNIVDGVWIDVANKVFDNLETDAASVATTIAGSTLEYTDLVTLQANVDADVTNDAYVTTRSVAAYLKKMATIGNVAGPVWTGRIQDGMVDGIPAVGTQRANTASLYYGDFSKLTVGQWGDIEVIYNPYSLDTEGELRVTANGMFDSGVVNPLFFSWIADVSI